MSDREQHEKIETLRILVDGHDEAESPCPNPDECATARMALDVIDALTAEVTALRAERDTARREADEIASQAQSVMYWWHAANEKCIAREAELTTLRAR